MMRTILLIITAVAVGLQTLAAQSITDQAAQAYAADDFNRALELYQQAAQEEGTSSELFYNIGNTYYKLDQNGMAILYYERALLLDPGNDDARSNLDFVVKKANIATVNGETYWKDSLDQAVSSVSSSDWGVIAIATFLLFIGMVVVYVFTDAVLLRKIGFFGGIVMLLCTIAANICAFHVNAKTERHNQAIVVVPSATLSTSPRSPKDKSEEAFLLNEGTKVEVMDSVKNTISAQNELWYNVRVNDNRAWISSSAIIII